MPRDDVSFGGSESNTRDEFTEEVPKLDFELVPVDRPFEQYTSDSELAEINEKTRSSGYMLSLSHRKYLHNSEAENEREIDAAVRERRDRLPERIHHLIRDVMLLAQSGYLDNHYEDIPANGETQSTAADIATFYNKVKSPDLEINHSSLKKALSNGADPVKLAELFNQGSKRELDSLATNCDLTRDKRYESCYESSGDLWSEIVDIKEYGGSYDHAQELYRPKELYSSQFSERGTPELRFGFEVGRAIQALQPSGNNTESAFIRGLVLAFYAESPNNIEREQDKTKSLVNDILEQTESREEKAEMNPTRAEIKQERSENESTADNVKKYYNIDSLRAQEGSDTEEGGAVEEQEIVPLSPGYIPELTDEDEKKKESAEDVSESPDGEKREEESAERGHEITPIDPEPEPEPSNEEVREEIAEAIREYGLTPVPILLDEVRYHTMQYSGNNIYKKFFKRAVAKMSEQVPLKEVETLSNTVQEDINTIKERSVRGLDADAEPLICLWKENKVSSDDNVGHQSKQKNSYPVQPDPIVQDSITSALSVDSNPVSESLNRYIENSNYKLVSNHPLVRRKNRQRGTEWVLTKYGMLVCYTLVERQEEQEWMYRFALGPEDLSIYERKLIADLILTLPM